MFFTVLVFFSSLLFVLFRLLTTLQEVGDITNKWQWLVWDGLGVVTFSSMDRVL